jgi:hypothetical protein
VVARRLTFDDVLQVLCDLFVERGPPAHISSDNGPEFVAKVVRGWLGRVGVTTQFTGPAVLGRMATMKHSTASCGTNCWTGRSSIRCGKPRC